jgi:hypothetical protein
MENLINDSSFEVYHNSEGLRMLNPRILTTYPSEKSSFQVDLGFEGHSNFINEETEAEKKARLEAEAKANKTNFDPEKVAGAITSGATAITSVATTIQAFKGDGTKAPSPRKALKEVCGRRPLTKKNRKGTYDKCVADYNLGKNAPVSNIPPTPNTTDDDKPNEGLSKTKKTIIGLVVVAVIVGAYIGYKKGLFSKKKV